MKNSEYALCFYRLRLNKYCQTESQPITTGVKIMFISRDPNLDMKEIKAWGSPIKTVIRKVPCSSGVSNFFYDFLLENKVIHQFLKYLENTKSNPIPKFYWTHLVKCYATGYAKQHRKKVDECVTQASESCKEYLKKRD